MSVVAKLTTSLKQFGNGRTGNVGEIIHILCSFGPQESPAQTGPGSVQPFLHSEIT